MEFCTHLCCASDTNSSFRFNSFDIFEIFISCSFATQRIRSNNYLLTQDNIPSKLPLQLLNVFADVSENYIFCFHSINPLLLLPDVNSLKRQRMFFSKNYDTHIDVISDPGRFKSWCNVIFHSLDVSRLTPFLLHFGISSSLKVL